MHLSYIIIRATTSAHHRNYKKNILDPFLLDLYIQFTYTNIKGEIFMLYAIH